MTNFKPIPGYETLFEVNPFGDIKSIRTGRILKQHVRRDGYKTVATRIGGRQGVLKTFRVHRVVAQAFIPNPDNKPEVNHKNGNKSDNTADNLEWVTSEENIAHSLSMCFQKHNRGTANPLSKLDEHQVSVIRSLRGKVSQRELAKLFGVHHTQIGRIQRLETYIPNNE